jgi:hypothetical protein
MTPSEEEREKAFGFVHKTIRNQIKNQINFI